MKVLFLVPYPVGESPSQRFRFEQYLGHLIAEGHTYHIQSFLNHARWREFARPGKILFKLSLLIIGYTKRLIALPTLLRYDVIFIHRETAPAGPPMFEWLIARLFRKRIIFDFDDAIWLTDRQDESPFLKKMKWRRKTETICRLSYKVSCGNNFLCRYAERFNQMVVYNPTTIDTDRVHKPKRKRNNEDGEITIGWTGSSSTLKYLENIEGILVDLERLFPTVRFLVIADAPPSLELRNLTFKEWNLQTEIADLQEIDIGIMPLPDDEWSKGKCAFKALQYMALEIPTIASPVGANTTVISHGIDGFLASTPEDWLECFATLLRDETRRIEMGKKARQKVIDQFSVRCNASRFLSLFD